MNCPLQTGAQWTGRLTYVSTDRCVHYPTSITLAFPLHCIHSTGANNQQGSPFFLSLYDQPHQKYYIPANLANRESANRIM